MDIQSISVVVPTKACVNNCKFCVSKMHDNPYCNNFDEIAYRKRIKRAAIANVTTLILTGTGEPLQNSTFLHLLEGVLIDENNPFPNIELQTTGVLLDQVSEHIRSGEAVYFNAVFLRALGVNTISLSVSDIFDSENNWNIIGAPKKLRRDLPELCKFIKDQGFNLRLSLNMTNVYDNKYPEDILMRCKELGADQITFRKLYGGGYDTPESEWVDENACKDKVITQIEEYIAGEVWHEHASGYEYRKGGEGKRGYKLPFGAWVYSIDGMSVAIDDDCMAKNESNENLKYVILRENGKLYWAWDDEGSLIF